MYSRNMSVMGPTSPMAVTYSEHSIAQATPSTSNAGATGTPSGAHPVPHSAATHPLSADLSETASSLSPACSSPQKKKLRVDGDVDDVFPPASVIRSIAREPLTESNDSALAPAAEIDREVSLKPTLENDAASQSAESPASSHHLITWAVSTEKGYRNTFGGNRLSIHPEMEDVHWPVHGTTPPAKQSPPSTPNGDRSSSRRAGEILADGSQLFVLADGHGGVEAPRFFVAGAVESVGAIWNERSWDLEDMDQRGEFRAQVHQAFKVLDATYASQKVEEYRRWMDARKDTNGGDDADLPSKAGKPVDDGCTLVVNIITKGWVININVGDSRTVVGMKADADHGSTWDPVFESSDHNMTHPAKIHHIQRTGGQFIYPYGTLRTIELCAADGKPITAETKIPTTPYTQLEGMRIYRPPSAQIRAVGVSHRRTLNLSATMGDLLFKVEPAVLSCVPDVEFVKLRSDRPYILVAATDGVWDHMRVQDAALQAQIVLGRVANMVDPSALEFAAPLTPGSVTTLNSPRTPSEYPFPIVDLPVVTTPSAADTPQPSFTPMDSFPFPSPNSRPISGSHGPQSPTPETCSPPATNSLSCAEVSHGQRLAWAARMLVERERGRNKAWNSNYECKAIDTKTLGAASPSPSGPLPAAPPPSFAALPDLFYSGQMRYDDATAFIVYLQNN